jgi:prepilin-type processing-associated H-X9-DG protein
MPYFLAPYLVLPAASSEVRTAKVAICSMSLSKAPSPVWADPRSLDQYLSYIVSIAVTNLTSDVVTRPFGYPYGDLHGADEQPKKAHEIRNPSTSWAITDADQINAAMEASYYLFLPQGRAHGEFRNQLFFDWHVEKERE